MPSPSPFQTLPLHVVEMIVEHVAASVRRLPSEKRNYGDSIEKHQMLQIPLLWVCRNFRAIVHPRIYKCYELKFEWYVDRVRGTPTGLPNGLEQLRGPFHLVAKEVKMLVGAWTIFSGFASGALTHYPYNGCSFPLARTLEISFHRSNEQEKRPAVLLAAEANITTFLQRIRQMMPRLSMVKLVGGLTSREQREASIPHLDSLATQLIGLVSRVDFTSGRDRVIPLLQLDAARNLMYLRTNFDLQGARTVWLIRQSAPTLQHLRIMSHSDTDLAGVITGVDGRFVEYTCLHTLVVRLRGNPGMPRQYNFDGAVPFPNLRRLITGGGYPFGDDLVMFKGNAATLEALKLTLTRELVATLLQRNIFTPTSHPKLQCVMFELPERMTSLNHVYGPGVIRLMADIAPGAAVREISRWYLDNEPPHVLSLFDNHTSLRILALPNLRLSIWSAMTLIKSLPLLSDLHAEAPTLDPIPSGVNRRDVVAYVSSNYSPMGAKFQCWHIENNRVEYSEEEVVPFLLLALVCPNFDHILVVFYMREMLAKQLEKAIHKTTPRKHAARWCRLVSHIQNYC
ncbi:hypothetical protein IW146_003637 [Coemansia sp. RSA 922]|nr:hypothetical protein H4S03_001046 [Coemansia sp. S3946]KAJ2052494.1 hypothetical protein H4S04_001304 [Coemansia sp. S16]KAJ2113724.1 hypothetical protein IW146_003637 [Coemansia sp. RSA 922]KAJ2350611.1 hypothetical protein GGH92_002283 [Coemansia sp. RSA 2673]